MCRNDPGTLAGYNGLRMNAVAHTWRWVLGKAKPVAQAVPSAVVRAAPPEWAEAPPVDIAPDDPIMAYFQSAPGIVDLGALRLDSPASRALRAAGVRLVVPLVSQGELIGLLHLGPRLSDQEYSADDRKLLENLAAQAAPAVRVAQLVREQQAEARRRERIEHELHVARLIQQHFLPKQVPALPGWELVACYRPAQAVGGDFYDFIELPEGQLGLVIGDVTDKGVPAALVMAATRSMLRGAAQQLVSPSAVLERVNDLMCPETPPNMFVTCLYAVLNPETGRLRYANAGQNLPYVRTEHGVLELRATGMPLGLLPARQYDEKEAYLAPGEQVLFHSDGLVEAHNRQREMFGFPRLMGLVGTHPGGAELIQLLLADLERFTGEGWEQEDDVTLVSLRRLPAAPPTRRAPEAPAASTAARTLVEFSVPSAPGTERLVTERVAAVVRDLDLPPPRLERLKTAVAEATMNAIEHGNRSRPELPVTIRVLASAADLTVQVIDQGGDRPIPAPETPDLEAKVAGRQRARGWGLFLIKNMVDELDTSSDGSHHIVRLTLHLEGDPDAAQPL
jgi:serine phosphatase RsbU (regulator of sigma subunit)/anti-sigma regulatory factor (Ser/Thr protein kinase)